MYFDGFAYRFPHIEITVTAKYLSLSIYLTLVHLGIDVLAMSTPVFNDMYAQLIFFR